MILPPVVRVFFAIDLPEGIKRALSVYMESLRKLSKTNQIRWTRPDNLHITLQFLAEVRRDDIPTLTESVHTMLASAQSPIPVTLRELHLYPDPHRPRVLVIDVAPQEAIANWSALIGKGIQQVGYEIETRPFRAHLSIARIKTSQMTALSFLATARPPSLGTISTNEVVLFQSEPHPDGSRYLPLRRIALGT